MFWAKVYIAAASVAVAPTTSVDGPTISPQIPVSQREVALATERRKEKYRTTQESKENTRNITDRVGHGDYTTDVVVSTAHIIYKVKNNNGHASQERGHLFITKTLDRDTTGNYRSLTYRVFPLTQNNLKRGSIPQEYTLPVKGECRVPLPPDASISRFENILSSHAPGKGAGMKKLTQYDPWSHWIQVSRSDVRNNPHFSTLAEASFRPGLAEEVPDYGPHSYFRRDGRSEAARRGLLQFHRFGSGKQQSSPDSNKVVADAEVELSKLPAVLFDPLSAGVITDIFTAGEKVSKDRSTTSDVTDSSSGFQ